jgi:hypothetical protein
MFARQITLTMRANASASPAASFFEAVAYTNPLPSPASSGHREVGRKRRFRMWRPRLCRLPTRNARTLSGVTRRSSAEERRNLDRRVTSDRDV